MGYFYALRRTIRITSVQKLDQDSVFRLNLPQPLGIGHIALTSPTHDKLVLTSLATRRLYLETIAW